MGNPRCLPEAPLRRPPGFPGARGLPHPPASLLTHRWGSGFFPDGLWEKSGLLCREKPKICSQQLAQRKLCFSTGPESRPAVGGGRSSTTSPPSGRGPCQTGILTYGGREMHHRCSLGGEGALPKLRIISEPGFPGRQQFLQECPRLLPGGLAQAHEAVESRLAPKQSEHKDAREKPQAYPPADRRGRQPSLQFTQDPRAFVLSSAIRPVSRGKAPFIPLWTCAQLSMARSGQLSRWAGYPPVAEGGGDPLQSAGLSAGVCTDPST